MDERIIWLFFLLCKIAVQGQTEEEIMEAVAEVSAACIDSTGVSEDLVNGIKEGKFADDEKLKCYLKCFQGTLGLMGDDGTMDIDTMIQHMPDDYKSKYESRIRACGTIHGSNLCETAWLTLKCYGENIS